MRSVAEHLETVLAGLRPLEALDVGLLEARGCHLAAPVVASWPVPPFDHAALDGYAVLAADCADADPTNSVTLRVVDDVPAGYRATQTVRSGTAIRVMSGAPVPPGADSVIARGLTDGGAATVDILAPVSECANIRLTGSQLPAGREVLPAGTYVGAREVALLAAVGRARVSVCPKPRVVVISTGTELIEPGGPLSPGLMPDSNGLMLTAAAEDAGALAYRAGPVADEQQSLTDTLEDQLVRADLVVTTGGVSADAFETVKTVLSRLGSVEFARVAMNPGMAQGFGHLRPESVPIFTLPGDPVSAFVSFEVFVRPVIRALLGHRQRFRWLEPARLTSALSSPADVRSYILAVVEQTPTGPAVSPVAASGLVGMVGANALIVLPEQTRTAPSGSTVSVIRLDRG